MEVLKDQILVHAAREKRLVVELEDIFFIEAVAVGSRIRLRRKRPIVDVRKLGQLDALLGGHGFLRIHRNTVVNLSKVQEIRRRKKGKDWELKLEPPVNRVLPISRDALPAVWEAFGE